MVRQDVVVHSEVVGSDQGASNGGADEGVGAVAPDLGPLRVSLVINLFAEEVGTLGLLLVVGDSANLRGPSRVVLVLGGESIKNLGGGSVLGDVLVLGDGLVVGRLLARLSGSDSGAAESDGDGCGSSNGCGAEVTLCVFYLSKVV